MENLDETANEPNKEDKQQNEDYLDEDLTATDEDYKSTFGEEDKKNLSGLAMDIENQVKYLTKATYSDRHVLIRTYMAACYMLGVTSPEKEIEKKVHALDAHGQVLANCINRCIGQVKKLEGELLDANDKKYKTTKVREDLKFKIKDLEDEIAKEKQESGLSKTQYANATAEEKIKIKQILNGYTRSKYLKDAEKRDLNRQLAQASRIYRQRFARVERLESRISKYEGIARGLYKMDAENAWLADQFRDIIDNSDTSTIDMLKKMTKIGKELEKFAKKEKKLAEYVNAANDGFNGLPDAVGDITNMEERDAARRKRNNKTGSLIEEDVLIADKLQEGEYMPS